MTRALLATAAATALLASSASAQQTEKVGVLLGYTGPIESLTPGMAASAELALQEVNESGQLLGGDVTLEPVRADSTCIDNAAATAAAERLVNSENVLAIVGADCSGVTTAVVNNVAVPNGLPIVSPSATSPALSTIEDDGLFFRTAPSDARQGEVLANILMDKGIEEIAVTYTNNDYGKGLASSFQQFYEDLGGEVLISSAHEDGKGDYSAEVGALQASGADMLCVFGYADQGGVGIIRASVDTGAFDRYCMADGMYSESLLDSIGQDLNGSVGSVPWSEGEGAEAFIATAEEHGVDPDGTFRRESYDAAALLALAMQKAGEASRETIAANVMDVANAPGEKILPGELGKGLKILADGGDVDYEGATAVELIGPGEASGTYREYVVEDGEYKTVKFR